MEGVWGKRKILLSHTLELVGSRREAIEAGITRAGGIVVRVPGEEGEVGGSDEEEETSSLQRAKERERDRREAHLIPTVDILITRWRSTRSYHAAFSSSKTIGTLAWLFHVQASGVFTSPLEQLLHYPVPRRDAGMGGHEITLTNYTGEAREYLKKLITAMGATFTPSMTGRNTVLVAAFLGGTKADKALTWSIPVVNHTWLEDCFIQWRNLTVATEKYIVFPPGVDFSKVLGERGVGRAVELSVLEKEMEEEEEEEEEMVGEEGEVRDLVARLSGSGSNSMPPTSLPVTLTQEEGREKEEEKKKLGPQASKLFTDVDMPVEADDSTWMDVDLGAGWDDRGPSPSPVPQPPSPLEEEEKEKEMPVKQKEKEREKMKPRSSKKPREEEDEEQEVVSKATSSFVDITVPVRGEDGPKRRGRPRKDSVVDVTATPAEMEAETPRRRSGRPRKSGSLVDVTATPARGDNEEPKKRRGRPSKSDSLMDVTATPARGDDDEPKKHRGRPRKSGSLAYFTSTPAAADENEEHGAENQKKHRGRSRKSDPFVDDIAGADDDGPVPEPEESEPEREQEQDERIRPGSSRRKYSSLAKKRRRRRDSNTESESGNGSVAEVVQKLTKGKGRAERMESEEAEEVEVVQKKGKKRAEERESEEEEEVVQKKPKGKKRAEESANSEVEVVKKKGKKRADESESEEEVQGEARASKGKGRLRRKSLSDSNEKSLTNKKDKKASPIDSDEDEPSRKRTTRPMKVHDLPPSSPLSSSSEEDEPPKRSNPRKKESPKKPAPLPPVTTDADTDAMSVDEEPPKPKKKLIRRVTMDSVMIDDTVKPTQPKAASPPPASVVEKKSLLDRKKGDARTRVRKSLGKKKIEESEESGVEVELKGKKGKAKEKKAVDSDEEALKKRTAKEVASKKKKVAPKEAPKAKVQRLSTVNFSSLNLNTPHKRGSTKDKMDGDTDTGGDSDESPTRRVTRMESIRMTAPERASAPPSPAKPKSKTAPKSTAVKTPQAEASSSRARASLTPAEEDASSPLSTLSFVPTRRSAANKATQRLRETVMPDVMNFEQEMRKARKSGAFTPIQEKKDANSVNLGKRASDVIDKEEDEREVKKRKTEPEKEKKAAKGKGRARKSDKETEDEAPPTTSAKGTKGKAEDASPTKKRATPTLVLATTQVNLSEEVTKALSKLGVKTTDKPAECTHLLANHLVRTEKFICAVAMGAHIITEKWAVDSAKSKKLLPEDSYTLKDKEGEKRFNMNLVEVLQRVRQSPSSLLSGKTFYVTPKVGVNLKLLKNVITSCGGQLIAQAPTIRILSASEDRYVISCPDDVSIWRPLANHNFTIYLPELVLMGALRQELNWDDDALKVPGSF